MRLAQLRFRLPCSGGVDGGSVARKQVSVVLFADKKFGCLRLKNSAQKKLIPKLIPS